MRNNYSQSNPLCTSVSSIPCRSLFTCNMTSFAGLFDQQKLLVKKENLVAWQMPQTDGIVVFSLFCICTTIITLIY